MAKNRIDSDVTHFKFFALYYYLTSTNIKVVSVGVIT